MNEHPGANALLDETLARIEDQVRDELTGLIRAFRLAGRDQGLVLQGHAQTYYAKQMAQHTVMKATGLPIRANEIEVS